jgi:reductive dehalogenase
MVTTLVIIHAAFLAVCFLITLAFTVSSIWERETRAALIGGAISCGLLIGMAGLVALAVTGFFAGTLGLSLLLAGLLVPVGASALCMRTAGNPRALQGTKGYLVADVQRFDQREQVFARNRAVTPGSANYRELYRKHPEWEERDAVRRQHGLLGVPGAVDKPHEGPNVAATFACLSTRDHLGRPEAVHPTARGGLRVSLSPEESTERCKGLARHLGADLVGVAEIDPHWIYSHHGDVQGKDRLDWGKEIVLKHTHAIVVAAEMSVAMVATAPHTPTVMETGHLYAKTALIAAELAAFVANLGYSATANHFGYYEAILPPLAVDAGLGEVGRLGYLITEQFGPRVRLACVTTDMQLVPDRPVDIGVEDFCKVCNKCAVLCPSRSIPVDDPKAVQGILRWKLNAETCFDYWGKIGTDCNVCMRVCPWSHPRTWPHRLVTKLVVRNRWSRRVFSILDDLFYGKTPGLASGPRWAAHQ